MKNPFTTIAALVIGSFAVSCTGGQTREKEVENTKPQIVATEVSYSSDTTNMNGFLVYDAAMTGQRPGVLVVHEWWGHNDYVRSRARMLAEQGYVALAVDMYGDGQTASHPEDAMKFSGMVMQNMQESRARFEAAYDLLASDPRVAPGNISAIGYCFGGSLIMSFANDGMDLDGVAAFHSGVSLPIPPSTDLTAKVLVQNGSADPFIPEESVAVFKEMMDAAGASYEYISYPGVLHGFTNPGADELGERFNLPLKYDREADEQSWNKLLGFLSGLYQGS